MDFKNDAGTYLPEVQNDKGLISQLQQNYRNEGAFIQSEEDFAKSISLPGDDLADLINKVEYLQNVGADLLAQGYGTPNVTIPGVGVNFTSALNKAQEAMNPSTPSLQASGRPTELGTSADLARYTGSPDFQAFGFVPSLGKEQEYRYGRNQGWGETIGRAFAGSAVIAANTFAEGWMGWARSFSALVNMDASKLYGSEEERYEIAKKQEDIFNKYAIYNTQESDESLFSRQFFGNSLQQLGFTIGAAAQIALETYLTGGLAKALVASAGTARAVKAATTAGEIINDTRKVQEAVLKSERVVNSLEKLGRTFVPLYGTVQDVTKLYKAGAGALQLSMAGLGGIKREFSMFNMARSEAIFEAAGTYKRMEDKLVREFRDENGRLPNAQELEAIRNTADRASSDNFYTNTGILMVMNRIQFDNMFKSFNGTRKLFTEGLAKYGDEAFEVTAKVAGKQMTRAYEKGMLGGFSAVRTIAQDFGKKRAAWEATKSIGRGLMKFETSEGVQELLQEASDQGLSKYYYDLYHGSTGYGTKLDEVMGSVKNPLTDLEGAKTFLMGAITGRLIAPFTYAYGKATGGKQAAEHAAKRKEAVQIINSFYANPAEYVKEQIANVKVQNKAAETMEEAAKNHDRYTFHNVRDSAFAKAVAAAISLDMYESMRDVLREFSTDMTDKEFKEAFAMEASAQNKKNVSEFMNKIGDQMDEYYTIYNNLVDKYGDRIVPELYKNNSPEEYARVQKAKLMQHLAIEMMTTNVFKARQAVKRGAGLQQEVAANKNIGASSLEVFTKMGSEQALDSHIGILQSQIIAYEKAETLTPEQRALLKEYKEELTLAQQWKSAFDELNGNDRSEYSPALEERAYKAYADLINFYNKKAKKDITVSKEDVDETYIKLIDYISLNKDHKSFIDAMNMLADPYNMEFMAQLTSSALDEMGKMMQREHLKEVGADTEEQVPGKVNEELGIQEGKEYLTQATTETRYYKGKQKTTAYKQDIIKIVSINDDGTVTFTVNNDGETVTFTNEEFQENIGKLYPMDKLTPEQRIYFRNRNTIFTINVRAKSGKKHLILGPHAGRDYRSTGIDVEARLELAKETTVSDKEPVLIFDENTGKYYYEEQEGETSEEYVLRVIYKNPVTGKRESFEYDAAYLKMYGGDKVNLLSISQSEEEYLAKEAEKRKIAQINILNKAIDDILARFNEVDEKKKENQEKYNKLKDELDAYLQMMEQLQEEIAKLPPKKKKGAKTKERKLLEERHAELTQLIARTKETIAGYEEEIKNLEAELETIEKIYEAYSFGVRELQETGVPFTRDETGDITPDEVKKDIAQMEQDQLIKPKRNISNEKLDQMVVDTENEIAVLTERIGVLNELLDRITSITQFDQVPDMVDALEQIDDKGQLLKQLVLIKNQESDPAKRQIVQGVINMLQKRADSIETAYLFELADRFNESKRELQEISNKLSATEDKLLRLYEAKDQRNAIEKAKERAAVYKTIQDELIRQYKIRRERAGVKQEGNKILVSVGTEALADDLIAGPDAIVTTQVVEDLIPDGDAEAESYTIVERSAPVISPFVFFKTAGRHFADLNDTTLNSQEDARFFKFAETAVLRDQNGTIFYLMPVTKDSKEFQDLRITSWEEDGETVNFDDDIRLVVVRRDASGQFRPVDVNGNILENPTKDNMVYTAMIGNPKIFKSDKEALEWVSKNFVNKNNYTPEQILSFLNGFKSFRESVKEKVKNGEQVLLPIQDKSPGRFNREPKGYTDDGELQPQELSLQGRLIENNPDFNNLRHPDGSPTKLTVSTFNGKVRAGRLLMVKANDPNSSILVYNRKFTAEEQQRIIDLLKRMAELFELKAVDLLTPELDDEFRLGIRYLQGVIHWFSPKEGFAPYSFQMWVQSGLHIGNEKIDFTPEAIEENKDKILAAIPYHKVNNSMLSDKRANDPFTDIRVIDNKIVAGTQYVNYQHYLLADREGGPVVYTNIKPYSAPKATGLEAQDFQLKNVYFTYNPGDLAEDAPEEEDIEDASAVAEKPSTGVKTYSVIQQEVDGAAGQEKMVKMVNNIPKGPKLTFVRKRADGVTNLYIHTEYVDGKYKVFQVIDEKGEDRTNVVTNGKTSSQANEEIINTFIEEFDNDILQIVPLSKKNVQDEAIVPFFQTFISIEDYSGKGKVITPSIVAAAPVTPAAKPTNTEFDNFVDQRYAEYADDIISAGEEPLDKEEFLDMYNAKLKAEFNKSKMKAASAPVSTDAKADIERRKKLSKDGGTTKNGDEVLGEKDITTEGEYITPSDDVEIVKGSDKQDVLKKIKAKYDAELAALQQASAPKVNNRVEDVKYAIKQLEDDLNARVQDFISKGASPEEAKTLAENEFPKADKEALEKLRAELAQLTAAPKSSQSTGNVGSYFDLAQQAAEDDEIDPNARVNNPNAVSKENIEEFKAWMNKNLPQFMVEVFGSLVDGRFMGQFYNGTVRLYQNAEEGTGFHEAFEAVWNALLTPQQQQAIIEEYKNRPDWKNQESYKWAKKNYAHLSEASKIKEALAEEFRDYMLSDAGNVKEQSPKRNTWFRKLWNFIKQLLGMGEKNKQEMEDKIQSLFGKIASGGFRNQEILPSYDPTMKNNRAIKGTSVEFTQALMEGMTATFFDFLYSNDGNVLQLFDRKNNLFDEYYKKTFNQVFNSFNPGLKAILKNERFQAEPIERQKQEIEFYKQRMAEKDPLFDMKSAALMAFNTEVKDQFKKYLTQFGLSFTTANSDGTTGFTPFANMNEELMDELMSKEDTANGLGIREVIYVDPTTLTNPSVRLLILSLTADKQDIDGRVMEKEKNSIGLTSLVPYKRKMNILLNELSNIVPVMRKQADGTYVTVSALDGMVENLKQKFGDPVHKARFKPGFEWINKLLKRLKYDQLKEGVALTDDELRLLVAFENAFNRNRNIPLKVIVGKDGRLRHVDAISVNTVQKIKEEWRSNVKDKALKTDIQNLENGDVIYINPGGFIEVNLKSKKLDAALNASTFNEKLQTLARLGMKFSVPAERLSASDQADIEAAFNAMKGVLRDRKSRALPFMYSEFFDRRTVEGPLNRLLAIEANIRTEDTLLSHLTPEGKTQYAITLPSELSNIINSLAGVQTLEEFIKSNPQYGEVENGTIVFNPYVRMSRLLRPGGMIFDQKGNKIYDRELGDFRGLQYEYIQGMASDQTNDGDNTDALTFNDKITQEMYHIMRGTYFSIINSDKSSEFGIRMGHFLKPGDVNNMNLIEDMYLEALRDEVMHALTFHFSPVNIQNHQSRILMLGHFSGILGFNEDSKQGSTLQKEFNRLVNSTKVNKRMKREAREQLYTTLTDNFVSSVKNSGVVKKYLNDKIEEHKQWLLSREIVTKNEATGKYNTLSVPADNILMGNEVMEMNELRFNQLVTFLTVNRQLNIFEQHKLFYGHPALYKDLPKRSNGANSQKNAISENPDIINQMNRSKPRYDGRERNTEHPIVRSLTYADPESTSYNTRSIAEMFFQSLEPVIGKARAEKAIGAKFNKEGQLEKLNPVKGTYMAAYIKMTEADGQSYIMPDYFRDLLYLSSLLTKEQEAFLDYEYAEEVFDRSTQGHPHYKRYSQPEIDKAMGILYDENGNRKPRPKAIIQPLKPQGFGFSYMVGGKRVSMGHVNMLKNSVFPLTWSRVKSNPTMMAKYVDAQNKGGDIINFISGHKVGAVTKPDGTMVSLYNPDGSINTEVPVEIDLLSKYMGIQVETAPYAKERVIFGSQIRKIILSNLPKALESRREEYIAVIDRLIEIERQALLDELGLEETQDEDGNSIYLSRDLSKMMTNLREQAIRRGLPDNVLDMLETYFVKDYGDQLRYPLDSNPARERIEYVLQAMVDSRIVRMEMFGKAAVQVSSAMWEGGNRNLLYLKDGIYEQVSDFNALTDKEKKSVTLASSDLKFYSGENGYMEVYLPSYFAGISDLSKAGFTLKNGIWMPNDPKAMESLLSAIGFRIPTQAFNSVESIRIKGFLDESYGDMVVVPSEMVGKSGSDFDIDKLNILLANYKVQKGKPVYINYSTKPEEIKQRYIDFVNRHSEEDAYKYINLLSREDREALREKFREELVEINRQADLDYKRDANTFYEEYQEGNEQLQGILNDNDSYFKELYQANRKQYRRLSSAAIESFNTVKDHIRQQGISGPQELQLYMSNALMLQASGSYEADNQVLSNMIRLYEEELKVLGYSEQLLSEHKEALLSKLREQKSELKKDIEENKTLAITDIMDSRDSALEDIYLQMAQEIASLSGLPTLEEFSKLPVIEQNGKKALQNRLLEIMRDIVEHPENRRQLLVPNSTARLKAIAKDIIGLRGATQVENDMTKLSEWKSMAETRETFVTSKQLVGVGALHVTSHVMAQVGEIELSGNYEDMEGKTKTVEIKLPNSNTLKLDLTIDSESEFIFDLLSEALSGSVDAAKDPFIYELRLNLDTAATWFYLTKRGVSQSNIALFMNQPIIDQFFKNRDVNKTYVSQANDTYLYFNEVVIKTAKDYYEKATGIVIPEGERTNLTLGRFRALQQEYKSYSPAELTSMIANKTLSKEDAAKQVALLMDMLDYREQADMLSDFIRGISYDTAKTKSMIENRLQELRYNKMVEQGFVTEDSINRVFERTFLGKMKNIKEDIQNMFADFFVTLQPKTLPAFAPVMTQLDNQDLFMTNEARMDLLNRYQSFVLGYILQNTPYGKNAALSTQYDLFKDTPGNESLPKLLKKLKDRYPNNLALKNLFPLINDNRNATDNIKLFNNKMSAYEINLMSESLESLVTMGQANGDMELQNFAEKLATFTILQSGLQLSPITFTKVMPIMLYANLAAKIFRSYARDTTPIDVENIWKSFHQNNIKNSNIVPKVKQKSGRFNNGLFVMQSRNTKTGYDYIKVDVRRAGVSDEDFKSKTVPYEQKFITRLFEKVKVIKDGEDITNKLQETVYRPINVLGNGMYLLETTPESLITGQSRFENLNEPIDESLYDETVKDYIEMMKSASLNSETPMFDSLPSMDPTQSTRTYAGIGSRETPAEVLAMMKDMAQQLEKAGFTVNTGNAKGADKVFRDNTKKKNVFEPSDADEFTKMVAAEIHPVPEALMRIKGGLELMARNTYQVFGANLDSPVDFVLVYDASGWEGVGPRPEKGGSLQAIDMAARKGIPVINMANEGWKEKLEQVLAQVMPRTVVKATPKAAPVKTAVAKPAAQTNAVAQTNTATQTNANKVVEGDIFAMEGIPVITTNLGGVHGAGLAQAAQKRGLVQKGDGVFKTTDKVVQLPVKKVWSDSMAMNDNMGLLKNSLRSLIITARQNPGNTYLLPLAGLGHGEGSVQEIMPLLIQTVKAAQNIKLVIAGENVNLGRQGTVRQDNSRQNMPEIKRMLAEAGLISNTPSTSSDDAQIMATQQYKDWARDNASPLMSEQENLDYYKQCKLSTL